MGGFGRAVRAELLKFFTTRMWRGMAIATLLGGGGLALLFAMIFTSDSAQMTGGAVGTPVQLANTVYTAGLQIGYLLMLTIGVMQVGSEYRHKTITSTFLAIPHRSRVMLAKVVALVVVGAGYGVVSLVGSLAVGAVTLQARGADPFPSTEIVRSIALSLLVLGLWCLIGLGVGILIPNQVAALLIGIGVAWILEPLVVFAMSFWEFGKDHIAPYLPSAATNAIVNGVQQGPDAVVLSWWVAALVLTAWAAVLAGFGIVRTVRQDVS